MVAICNKETLGQLREMILDSRVNSFTIEERSSEEKKGQFNMEFIVLETVTPSELEYRLRVVDALDEFIKKFTEGNVIRFFMHYDVDGLKCIVSKAYKNENEIFRTQVSNNLLGDDLVSILKKAIEVAQSTGVTLQVLPEITKKIKRDGGKPLYKDVQLGEILEFAILAVTKTNG